ncbi:hypothetical protein BMS3Abin17_01328 [archaeon BMS3Abin17]|nr:hypothetical protein BMS3Abin17_01328 [archaeon BMS3Abin17]HDZ60937.1 hypothetical protein [Candidatus Pacearchaeota archaeon]
MATLTIDELTNLISSGKWVDKIYPYQLKCPRCPRRIMEIIVVDRTHSKGDEITYQCTKCDYTYITIGSVE